MPYGPVALLHLILMSALRIRFADTGSGLAVGQPGARPLEQGLGTLHSPIERLKLKCKNTFFGTHFATYNNIHLLAGV